VQRSYRITLALFLTACFSIAGCAASNTAQSHDHPDHDNASFSNILVAAIADDYTNRAQYERTVVSGLRKHGVSATAYYEAVGGNKPISRDTIRELITKDGYDAVLLTRVLDARSNVEVQQGSAAAKITRRSESPIDFFRYDYEELNEPDNYEFNAAATLLTDLYSAANEKKVWTLEISNKATDNVGALIDSSAAKVVKRLGSDKLIGK